MAWDIALQGIGAGVKGALDLFSWQQERNDRRAALDEDRRQFDVNAGFTAQEIELKREGLKAEIRAMYDRLKDGKSDEPLEEVTYVGEDGAEVTEFIPRRKLPGRTFRQAPQQRPTPRKVVPVETTRNGRPFVDYRYEDELPGKSFEQYQAPRTTAPSSEPMVQIETVGPDGTPILKVVPRSRAAGDYPLPPRREGQSAAPAFDPYQSAEPRRAPGWGRDIQLPSGSEHPRSSVGQPPVTRPAAQTTSGQTAITPWAVHPTAAVGQRPAARQGLGRAAVAGPVAAAASPPPPAIDPTLDREAKTLMQQFDASTDPDEQAAIQYRMQQILDRIKGTR